MEKILIVEDMEQQALALQSIIVSHCPKMQILVATNVSDAQHIINEHTDISLFFLDIQLSETPSSTCDGISLGMQIRSITRYVQTPIIYVTSYSNRIQEALNTVHCFGFLYKPYTPCDVTNLLDEIFNTQKTSQFIQLKIDTSIFVNIDLNQLLYIKAQGHYLLYQTTNGTLTSRQYSMKQLLLKLPSNFIRCHKSYVVNKNFILNTDKVNRYIHIQHMKEPIPIGKNITL